MHPEPRQQSWYSRGEKSFLPGTWPRPPSLGLRPIHLVSVQKTNWILFRPLRGPEVCDAGFFSTQSLPLGGRTVRGTVRSGPGEATINHRWAGEAGSDEGAIRYPTFPCRKEAIFRLSPQRGFSIAPLGKSVAPSSVTFGDSFPPRGSLWVVQPYTKKRPKSGYADGHRNRRTTGTMRHNRQNERASSERALNRGAGGIPPRLFASGLSLEKAWIPRPGPGGNHLAGSNLRRSRKNHLPGSAPLDSPPKLW